jgi:hypothetical protein
VSVDQPDDDPSDTRDDRDHPDGLGRAGEVLPPNEQQRERHDDYHAARRNVLPRIAAPFLGPDEPIPHGLSMPRFQTDPVPENAQRWNPKFVADVGLMMEAR